LPILITKHRATSRPAKNSWATVEDLGTISMQPPPRYEADAKFFNGY
jgi:hypothetical protein